MICRFLTFLIIFCLSHTISFSQSFTSFFIGDTSNVVTNADFGLVLMGGATESDEAMKWFLTRAKGGDVLVIRASGSSGYNAYLYQELGVPINSVETILWRSKDASSDPYVLRRLRECEALWIAGGDQAKYIDFWKNTEVQQIINDRMAAKNLVIGGTSAGMAILGRAYFGAIQGTITSEQALLNPFDPKITVFSDDFLNIPYLEDVITDTHFDNPDRSGRLFVFLARLMNEQGRRYKGIASEEFSAVCIDEKGLGRFFGSFPLKDDFVWIIRPNCDETNTPEQIVENLPLIWNFQNKAVEALRIPCTLDGASLFDFNSWKLLGDHQGVRREYWYVSSGPMLRREAINEAFDCEIATATFEDIKDLHLSVFPNPVIDSFRVVGIPEGQNVRFTLFSSSGRFLGSYSKIEDVNIGNLPRGLIFLKIEVGQQIHYFSIIKAD